MTASPRAIKAAKSFATALASNIKLLNAFIAAERKIIQINPEFSTAELDSFLAQKGYECTIDQVAAHGAPMLSEPALWAGSYHTQVCAPGETTWTEGPMLIIGIDGRVTMGGVAEPEVDFAFLNMTFPKTNLLFYVATPPTKRGENSSNKVNAKNRAPAFMGTYQGKKISGLVIPPAVPKTSKTERSFMKTFNLLSEYMGQIDQAFMIYDLIQKATEAQEAGDAAKALNIRRELGPALSEMSDSQGEIAALQHSALESQMNKTGKSLQEAAAALRALQSDDLGVDEVPDVAKAHLDEAGAEIGKPTIEDGGLEIAATAGEDAIGNLAVDALLDDALRRILL